MLFIRIKEETINNKVAFAVFIFLIVVTGLVIFRNINNLGVQDWDQHYAYAEAARISILNFAQFPLWNPYHCGGISQIGNPQNDFLSPAFFLILLLGPVAGYKIMLLFFMFIGLMGFYYLGLFYKISKPGSTLLSAIYIMSGLIIIPFTVGMTNFMNIALLPFLCLFYLKALNMKRMIYVVYSSLLATLIFFGGYHYIINVVGLLLVISFSEFIFKKRLYSILYFFIFILFFSLLISIKLLPSVEQLTLYGRHPKEDKSGYTLQSLASSLYDRNQDINGTREMNFSYGIDENGIYVGIVSLVLLALGMYYRGWKNKTLLLIFIFYILLMFGLNTYPSLYEWLHRLPILNYMKVAQRYRYFFMIPYVLFVGFGFDFAIKYLGKFIKNNKLVQLLMGLLCLFMIYDILTVNLKFIQNNFNISPIYMPRTDNFIQRCSISSYNKNGKVQTDATDSSFGDEYIYILSGYGSSKCYEPLAPINYIICLDSGDYKGEFYLMNNNGIADLTKWSPNVLAFVLNLKKDDTLIINQNFDNNWKAIVNENKFIPVINNNGLLSVDLVADDQTLSFIYLPTAFLVGLIFSLVGLAASILIIKKFNHI